MENTESCSILQVSRERLRTVWTDSVVAQIDNSHLIFQERKSQMLQWFRNLVFLAADEDIVVICNLELSYEMAMMKDKLPRGV